MILEAPSGAELRNGCMLREKEVTRTLVARFGKSEAAGQSGPRGSRAATARTGGGHRHFRRRTARPPRRASSRLRLVPAQPVNAQPPFPRQLWQPWSLRPNPSLRNRHMRRIPPGARDCGLAPGAESLARTGVQCPVPTPRLPFWRLRRWGQRKLSLHCTVVVSYNHCGDHTNNFSETVVYRYVP